MLCGAGRGHRHEKLAGWLRAGEGGQPLTSWSAALHVKEEVG